MLQLVYLVFLIFHDQTIAEVCRSPECVQSSEYILSKMDLKADPCQDFYQYTCGNWVNATDIPEDKPYYNTQLHLSTTNIEKLKYILKDGDTFLNGTHSTALEKVSNFYRLCIDDNQQKSKAVEQVVQFRPSHYDYELSPARRTRLLDFVAKVGELLGGDEMSVMNELTKIYNLQVQMSNIKDKNYNRMDMNISAFQKILGNKINITKLLKNRFGPSSFDDFEVSVENRGYFEGLYSLISKTPNSTLANYIVWNALVEHIQYFPSQFVQAYNMLYLDYYQKEQLKNNSREDQCLQLLAIKNEQLFVAFGAIFQEKSTFSNESKDKINTIVKEVQSAFQSELMISPWLDDQIRQWAVKKASDIEANIGYVDWIRDAKQVDNFYGDLEISPGNFLQSSLKIKRSFERRILSFSDPKWRLKEIRLKLILEANANYDEWKNEFYLYLGILQKPLFTPEFPMSFNFGSIGYITGHEITHGFDNDGIFSEVIGTWSWWLKNQTSHEFFNAQMNCLLDQYSNYSIGNVTFDSRTSRPSEEQIVADNGGIQSAFNGFKNWQKSQDSTTQQELPGLPLSQDQMFFIGFGQTQCEYMTPRFIKEVTSEGKFTKLAGVFRSTGVVSNSNDFAEAFNCPRNTPMNPEAKCRIW